MSTSVNRRPPNEGIKNCMAASSGPSPDRSTCSTTCQSHQHRCRAREYQEKAKSASRSNLCGQEQDVLDDLNIPRDVDVAHRLRRDENILFSDGASSGADLVSV